jgi:hypothetical protein
MSRLDLAQLAQSGATAAGQVATWDGTKWVPATSTSGELCRAVLTAIGGEQVIYLNATPITNSDAVYVNGLRKAWGGVDYTISGSVITLTSPLTAGQQVIVTYQTAGVCGIPVLAPFPTGFTRPVPVTRLVRRFHRIR